VSAHVVPVAVICGGPSLEHEISLRSGHEVIEHMDRARYAPVSVVIDRAERWVVDGEEVGGALAGARTLRDRGIDTCFLALHGPYGEDGKIQAFLETAGFRYTGSGPTAMAVSGDKILAKRVAAANGIPVARDRLVPPTPLAEVEGALGLPCVVKDPHQGSTLGMEIVPTPAALNDAVARLGAGCERLLVEECVRGREFTVSILDLPPDGPRALPLTEIRAPDGYFDFEAKYSETRGAEEICPADVEEDAAERMKRDALTAHLAFGMRQMSRTDFLLRPDGVAVFLETNGTPGFTARSIYPEACRVAGIPFADLVTRFLDAARR